MPSCCGNNDRSFLEEFKNYQKKFTSTIRSSVRRSTESLSLLSTLFSRFSFLCTKIFQGFLYWFLVMATETGRLSSLKKLCCGFTRKKNVVGQDNQAFDSADDEKSALRVEDTDVIFEKSNVLTIDRNRTAVIAQNLQKWFRNSAVHILGTAISTR